MSLTTCLCFIGAFSFLGVVGFTGAFCKLRMSVQSDSSWSSSSSTALSSFFISRFALCTPVEDLIILLSFGVWLAADWRWRFLELVNDASTNLVFLEEELVIGWVLGDSSNFKQANLKP